MTKKTFLLSLLLFAIITGSLGFLLPSSFLDGLGIGATLATLTLLALHWKDV